MLTLMAKNVTIHVRVNKIKFKKSLFSRFTTRPSWLGVVTPTRRVKQHKGEKLTWLKMTARLQERTSHWGGVKWVHKFTSLLFLAYVLFHPCIGKFESSAITVPSLLVVNSAVMQKWSLKTQNRVFVKCLEKPEQTAPPIYLNNFQKCFYLPDE